MIFLNHSSPDTLVADLRQYLGRNKALVAVVFEDPPAVSLPWTLLNIFRAGRELSFQDDRDPKRNHYIWHDGIDGGEPYLTDTEMQFGVSNVVRLATCGPAPGGSSSPDDSLHRQLDDNLRRAFS